MNWSRAGVLGALAVSVAASAADSTPAKYLAEQLALNAGQVLDYDPLTVEAIAAARLLMDEAVRLNPDDPDLWRRLLVLADLVGEDEESRQVAIDQIGRLDPEDQVIRLQRLAALAESEQSVEERIQTYERLLTPQNIERFGRPVASRLAMDLASLHLRREDQHQYADWLAEAGALDRGNHAACVEAASFFSARVDDPVGYAELLTDLVLSNPSDVMSQAALGQLMLSQGAYAGAERMLRNATSARRFGGVKSGSDIFADLAIAHWGNGHSELALELIDRQQHEGDQRYRAAVVRETPHLTPLEVARLTAPVNPIVATVKAAILRRMGSPDAQRALDSALLACDAAIEAAGPDAPPAALAQLWLEKAWVAAWLGGDPAVLGEAVQTADALVPLSDTAKQRYMGWVAYRSGGLDEAMSLFEPLADSDMPARLGLAMATYDSAVDANGRHAAAQDLLLVARDRPGSLVSVWAADVLFNVLGTRAPISTDADKLENLVASIPAMFDRYASDPSLCLGLRVRPIRSTFGAYEPIVVELEISNNSLYPLAIDRNGPIRPQVLLRVSMRMAGTRLGELKPIIIDINRRLTLAPKERLTIPVNLRLYSVGAMLNQLPLPGAILKVEAMTNVVGTEGGALVPGPLGMKVESHPFRVDGVRISRAWIQEAMADVVSGNPDLRSMAVLSHVAAGGHAANLPAADQVLFDDAVSAQLESFAQLEPLAQAWLLSVMAAGPTTESVLDMARKSDHRLVKLAYLMHCVNGSKDPMLDAARRDEDPAIRQLGNLSEVMLKQREDQLDRLMTSPR